jgi:crotonobetainyl-CoA:carnitine CoA-transferase CaiB-like acyl-CoA transferase
MEAPLHGLVVLDLSQVIAGPETAMLLGELGADVIKIEKPSGDDARYMGADPLGQRVTKTFSVLNRNKRSLVLDLSKPEGKNVLYRLVDRADVVIEAYTAGTADRMGIGYEQLAQLNPRLIYASLTGFGTKGPYASKPAYDLIIQGVSGVMAARRWPDGTPIPAPFWVGDASAPFILAFGIMVAVCMREKTGRGQKVESSLLQAHLAMQGTQLVKLEDESGVENTASAAFVPYRCGDDEYLNVTILNERQWRSFCQVLDVEYLADDPEYNSVAKRQGKDELFGLIEGLLSMRPASEWQELIQTAGVPCGPVITRDQVFSNPQVVENEFFVRRDQPGLGQVQEMGFPLRFSEARSHIQRTAPLLGEHTGEVLQEFGFTLDELEELRTRGTIA